MMNNIDASSTQTVIALLILLCASIAYSIHIKRKLARSTVKADLAINELKAQLDNNSALLRTAVDGIHVINLKGDIVMANDAFCRLLGYDMDEVMQLNVTQWDAYLDKDELIPNIVKLRGQVSTFETRHRRKDGTILDVEINTVGVDINNTPLLFCSARDITERKAIEHQLRQAANVFHYSQESLMIINNKGIIADVNNAFTRITGYTREEAVGQCPPLINAEQNDAQICLHIRNALDKSGYWSGETWNVRKNGEVYATNLTISRVTDQSGRISNLVGIFSDITPSKRYQEQLEQIAHYDPLTQLPNRLLFADRLQHEVIRASRNNTVVAVVYLDLDGFKQVNDTCGHAAGDQLLNALATRMKYALRDEDTLARIGGDEFVAVLVDLESVEACEVVLKRLLSAAASPVMIDNQPHQVSASIGVACYPHDGIDADQLIRRADHAMYQAKQSGKNRYQFSQAVRPGEPTDSHTL